MVVASGWRGNGRRGVVGPAWLCLVGRAGCGEVAREEAVKGLQEFTKGGWSVIWWVGGWVGGVVVGLLGGFWLV